LLFIQADNKSDSQGRVSLKILQMNTSAEKLFGPLENDNIINGLYFKRVWTGNHSDKRSYDDHSAIPPKKNSEFFKNPLSLSQILEKYDKNLLMKQSWSFKWFKMSLAEFQDPSSNHLDV
jgi:hypothetical protein